MPKQVLFICIFNRSRSVVAEYLVRNMLDHKGSDYAMNVTVSSAGLLSKGLTHWFHIRNIPLPRPLFNQPPSKAVQTALLKQGIDISQHRSRPVTRAMLERSDIIIPMVSLLKEEIISSYPETEGKVFLPKELLGEEVDFFWEEPSVAPYDRDYLDFVHDDMGYVVAVIDEIDEFLQRALPAILSRLSEKGKKAEER